MAFLFGLFLIPSNIFGRCLEALWELSGSYLRAVLGLLGRCLEALWGLFENCLEAEYALMPF